MKLSAGNLLCKMYRRKNGNKFSKCPLGTGIIAFINEETGTVTKINGLGFDYENKQEVLVDGTELSVGYWILTKKHNPTTKHKRERKVGGITKAKKNK